MMRTRGLVAALTIAGLLATCVALTGGCDGGASAPTLTTRTTRPRTDARGYVEANVQEVREEHGRVSVVVELAPRGGLPSFSVGHYDLSHAVAQLRMADARGTVARVSDPVLTVGGPNGSPAQIHVPSQGLLLAVDLLDKRHVVMPTRVRGILAAPPNGTRLAYSLETVLRVANDRLDSFTEVPLRGEGALTYSRN